MVSSKGEYWAIGRTDRLGLSFLNTLGGWLGAVPTETITDFGDKRYSVITIGTPGGKPMVNAYIIKHSETGKFVMIDAGSETDADKISAEFAKIACEPKDATALFFTHGDIDHVAGAYRHPAFVEKPKFIGADDVRLIHGGPRLTNCGCTITRGPSLPDDVNRREIGQGDDFRFTNDELPGIEISVIPCQGHTPGSLVYRVRVEGDNTTLFFTGDALKLNHSSILNLTDIDKSSNSESLKTRLLPAINAEVAAGRNVSVFTGHSGYLMNNGAAIIEIISNL